LKVEAKKLDPVWTARISRPPVGVCVDHLTAFRQVSEFDSHAEVDKLVEWLDVDVPPEYRAFMLNYNHLIREIPTLPHGSFCPSDGGAVSRELINLWFVPTVIKPSGNDYCDDASTYIIRDRDEDYDLNPTTSGGTRLNAVMIIGGAPWETLLILCVGIPCRGEVRFRHPGSGEVTGRISRTDSVSDAPRPKISSLKRSIAIFFGETYDDIFRVPKVVECRCTIPTL
jgi:hypothetical protein